MNNVILFLVGSFALAVLGCFRMIAKDNSRLEAELSEAQANFYKSEDVRVLLMTLLVQHHEIHFKPLGWGDQCPICTPHADEYRVRYDAAKGYTNPTVFFDDGRVA